MVYHDSISDLDKKLIYMRTNNEIQWKMWVMEVSWLSAKADVFQWYGDMNDSKLVFSVTASSQKRKQSWSDGLKTLILAKRTIWDQWWSNLPHVPSGWKQNFSWCTLRISSTQIHPSIIIQKGFWTRCSTYRDIQDLWKGNDIKTHWAIPGHVDCRIHSSVFQRCTHCAHL